MPASSAHTAVAAPDPGRLRPPRLPRPPGLTRQLTAALAVAVLLVHLLFAPATLVLSALLPAPGRPGLIAPAAGRGPARPVAPVVAGPARRGRDRVDRGHRDPAGRGRIRG